MDMRHSARAIRPLFAALALVAAALLAGCGGTPDPVVPVEETPLSALSFTLALDTLQVPGTVTAVVVALDTNGVAVSSPAIRWSSPDVNVATVNSAGVVRAVDEGVAWIRAAYGGKSDSAKVFVFSATGWLAQASNTTNNLNGVMFTPDGREGWAVGDAGTIVHTSDAGGTWGAQPSSTAFPLQSVWFVTKTVGYAAGNGGTIMRTSNGGASWSRITSVPTAANLNDIQFVNANYGWAVGDNGVIVRTRDGGTTWNLLVPSTFTLHSVSFVDTTNGWAVGDNGTILGTRDAGASWFVTPSLTSQSLRGVSRVSTNSAWAAGQQGTVPFTTFVGTPADSVAWQLATLGASNTLEGVHFPTLSTGWVVGFSGTGIVLKTMNGGGSWAPQTANSGQRLNDVWFVDDQRGWAVGDGGRIIHTGRGGD